MDDPTRVAFEEERRHREALRADRYAAEVSTLSLIAVFIAFSLTVIADDGDGIGIGVGVLGAIVVFFLTRGPFAKVFHRS